MKHGLIAICLFTTGILGDIVAAEIRDIETAQEIELSAEHYRLRIHANGECAALIDLRDGTDYLADERVPIASMVCAGRASPAWSAPSNCCAKTGCP